MQMQQPPQGLAQLAQLQQLGLIQDPMAQLSGLINLINASQQSGQFDQELALKQQGLGLEEQRMMQQQSLAEQELAMRASGQQTDVDQFNQDFMLRKQLAEENRLMEIQRMQQQDAYQKQMLGLEALGLPARYAGSGIPINMEALKPSMQVNGLQGLFTQSAPANLPPMDPQQAAQYAIRQKMFPQQLAPQ
jgi:hypothetical protein